MIVNAPLRLPGASGRRADQMPKTRPAARAMQKAAIRMEIAIWNGNSISIKMMPITARPAPIWNIRSIQGRNLRWVRGVSACVISVFEHDPFLTTHSTHAVIRVAIPFPWDMGRRENGYCW